MLLYLEAARYKVGGTLAEVEGSKRDKHPLAEHILVSRDKQGLQQSVLKVSFRDSYRYLKNEKSARTFFHADSFLGEERIV